MCRNDLGYNLDLHDLSLPQLNVAVHTLEALSALQVVQTVLNGPIR